MTINHLTALALLSGCVLCGVAQAEPVFTLSNSAAFFQGKYGTDKNIDIYYDATDLQLADDNWQLKLTLPVISIKNLPQGAILTGGNVTTISTSTQTRDSSGIGDVWLEGRYKIFAGSGLTPSISPYAKVKFGTASADKGLGTGLNDYEAGVFVQQAATPELFPFAKVGYRVVGKPAGSDYRNIATYQVGASYALSINSFITPMFSGAQSIVRGGPSPADFIVAWNYNLTAKGSGIQVYVDKGLTNGSANYGIGIGGQIVF
ncbi:MAG: hypothetical protein ACYCY3_08290 [Halothiobacillus sp.]